jgi:hypothetical protein
MTIDAGGHGYRHRERRKRLAPKVAAGEVLCARCGQKIKLGEKWDLGHQDNDPNRYRGPEHVRCNRATAAHRTRQSQAGAKSRHSRSW